MKNTYFILILCSISLVSTMTLPSFKSYRKVKIEIDNKHINSTHSITQLNEFEGVLKAKGLWVEYEKNILNSDIDNIIKDFNIWIDEKIDTKMESYITEAGDVESWNGSDKAQLLKNKEQTIEYLQSLKK